MEDFFEREAAVSSNDSDSDVVNSDDEVIRREPKKKQKRRAKIDDDDDEEGEFELTLIIIFLFVQFFMLVFRSFVFPRFIEHSLAFQLTKIFWQLIQWHLFIVLA